MGRTRKPPFPVSVRDDDEKEKLCVTREARRIRWLDELPDPTSGSSSSNPFIIPDRFHFGPASSSNPSNTLPPRDDRDVQEQIALLRHYEKMKEEQDREKLRKQLQEQERKELQKQEQEQEELELEQIALLLYYEEQKQKREKEQMQKHEKERKQKQKQEENDHAICLALCRDRC